LPIEDQDFLLNPQKREKTMLAIIGAIVIICWLLGLTAFHVTTGVVHLALVVGLVLVVMHFLTGRSRGVL
jgi:hypothetical protein